MRILIADDQIEVRSALHFCLAQNHPDWRFDEAGKLSEITYLLQILLPDLLIIDWELPGLNSADRHNEKVSSVILAMFRRLRPGLIIVGLSAYPDREQFVINAGANLFLSKSDPPEKIMQTISLAVELSLEN